MNEHRKKTIVDILGNVRDFIEIGLPSIAFAAMFVVFIVSIFFRYVLRHPIIWALDIESTLFVWTIGLSAFYAYRTNSHVRFEILYQIFPLRVRAVLGILSNLLIIGTFCYSFLPSWRYIQFMNRSSLSSLQNIHFDLVYFPYILFLVATLVYCFRELYVQIMVLLGRGGKEMRTKMIRLDNITSEIIELDNTEAEQAEDQ